MGIEHIVWLAGVEAVVTVGERRDGDGRGAHKACQMTGGTVEGTSAPLPEGPYRGSSVVGRMMAAVRVAVAA